MILLFKIEHNHGNLPRRQERHENPRTGDLHNHEREIEHIKHHKLVIKRKMPLHRTMKMHAHPRTSGKHGDSCESTPQTAPHGSLHRQKRDSSKSTSTTNRNVRYNQNNDITPLPRRRMKRTITRIPISNSRELEKAGRVIAAHPNPPRRKTREKLVHGSIGSQERTSKLTEKINIKRPSRRDITADPTALNREQAGEQICHETARIR